MAEAPVFTEDDAPVQWKLSVRRSRKPGCSNIFSGVNMQQLRKLFRAAGDRDAERRANLAVDSDPEGAEERGGEGEGDEAEVEAGLAQALVGLRVRTRTKAGTRVEARRERKWLRGSGYVRTESLSVISVEEEEEEEEEDDDDAAAVSVPGPDEAEFPADEEVTESPNPVKPSSSCRLGLSRQDSFRDSERYLHRILH